MLAISHAAGKLAERPQTARTKGFRKDLTWLQEANLQNNLTEDLTLFDLTAWMP
jgi:hypothetical protein